MHNQYQIFTSAFNDQFCDHIISVAKLYREQGGVVGSFDATTGESSAALNQDIRNSTIRWVDIYAHREINTILNDYVNAVNSSLFGFDISFGFNSLQYTEYNGDGPVPQFYDWHMDCLFDNAVLDRKLSAVVQLSSPDDYKAVFSKWKVARVLHLM